MSEKNKKRFPNYAMLDSLKFFLQKKNSKFLGMKNITNENGEIKGIKLDDKALLILTFLYDYCIGNIEGLNEFYWRKVKSFHLNFNPKIFIILFIFL